MFYAEQVGLEEVYADIQHFHEVHGRLWEPAPLLGKLAHEGEGFSSLLANR